MVNFIGLTKKDGKKMLVNADRILFLQAIEAGSGTEVLLTGAVFLYVAEDMYEIVERTQPDDDCYWDDTTEQSYQAANKLLAEEN